MAYGYVSGNPLAWTDWLGLCYPEYLKIEPVHSTGLTEFYIDGSSYSPHNGIYTPAPKHNPDLKDGLIPYAEKIGNGVWPAMAGAYSGAISIIEGSAKAVRFIARGTGMLGEEEYNRWKQEELLVNASASVILESEEVRNAIADRVVDSASEIEWSAFNISKAASRVVTGVLVSPAGLLATIGDSTSAVEDSVDGARDYLTENVTRGIILGE